MPNNTPLTIENFEIDKIKAKPFKSKSGVFNYFAIPFKYDGGDPLIKIEGNCRVFRHENKEGISYSLAIEINENEEFSLNWKKEWLHLPANKRVKFQNHLSHQISNWLRLLEMASM